MSCHGLRTYSICKEALDPQGHLGQAWQVSHCSLSSKGGLQTPNSPIRARSAQQPGGQRQQDTPGPLSPIPPAWLRTEPHPEQTHCDRPLCLGGGVASHTACCRPHGSLQAARSGSAGRVTQATLLLASAPTLPSTPAEPQGTSHEPRARGHDTPDAAALVPTAQGLCGRSGSGPLGSQTRCSLGACPLASAASRALSQRPA